MKHEVKLVSVEGEIITLRVDGVLCCYFIQRPSPLGLQDTAMVRGLMDTRFLEVLGSSVLAPAGFWRRLLLRFRGLGGYVLTQVIRPNGEVLEEFVKPGNVSKSFGETVANYIDEVGVEVDIDKKTKGVIILGSDVDKIRKGDVQ